MIYSSEVPDGLILLQTDHSGQDENNNANLTLRCRTELSEFQSTSKNYSTLKFVTFLKTKF